MVARIIRRSLANPAIALLAAVLLAVLGAWAASRTLVDALPDLSDVQVIVRTEFPQQSPRIVEDQVTFPLSTALRSVPRVAAVRGYSHPDGSFVYAIFEDGTDPYWARSRVLESLAQVTPRLPAAARVSLGPDATGVGWIYEYALIDRSGAHDLAELRSLQDWFLKPELQALAGVAEVASVGGMVKQYQVVLDPDKLRLYDVTLQQVRSAIERGNGEAGGSAIELAEREYMVRATGYIANSDELRLIPVKVGADGTALLLSDVAEVRIGPQLRRGIAELDGEGEVSGGIVVMRHGQNAREVIARVQARLQELRARLPAGVEIVATYDRSVLIERAVGNLTVKLLEEFAVVLLVCLAFLRSFRSGLVVVITVPLAVLGAVVIMNAQGITANIMSLGGIAIAIGAMVDAAIVMVENVHRRLEQQPQDGERVALIAQACVQVGPALAVSLLIAALSFVPVLALSGQEGRLFAPLAFTKTYAMLCAALLSIVLVPALILLLVPRAVARAADNPLNRWSAGGYRPLLAFALEHPRAVVAIAALAVVASLLPAGRLGTQFMPDMDEGDLLHMATVAPGISPDAARALLQQTDRAIREVPEVERVFGKAGRAETATDPAPLEMLEILVMLRPRSEWRAGTTLESLQADLRAKVDLPGLAGAWLPPIKSRIEMLSTGVRATLGIRITGDDIATLQRTGARIEALMRDTPGVASVWSERAAAGYYIQVDPDRSAAARYGVAIADIHEVVAFAIGGTTVGESIEGRERYPINLRYPQGWRDSPEKIRSLPIASPAGTQLTLGDVAKVSVVEAPAMIRSEDARLASWVYIDYGGGDIASFVDQATQRIEAAQVLPARYALRWSGQYEYYARALERLNLIVPLVLATIMLLLYVNFRSVVDVLLVFGTLPVALAGAIWFLWALDYHVSVAVIVGLLALAGVAAETGVVMLLYLNQAWLEKRAAVGEATRRDLCDAIVDGALVRLRPKLMTVITIIGGLLPLMVGEGAGFEVMRRIAAPMIGGMLGSALLTLVVLPAAFLLVHERKLPD
jgi:copper/silver efflux system protein